MQEIISGFRISPQQKQLWRLQQHCNVSASVCAVRINGPLDVSRLREAVERLVQQHGVLRTSFQRLPGMELPVQVIADNCTPDWQSFDLSSLDEAGRISRIEALMRTEREALGDAASATPLRATLLHLGNDELLLIIALRALCADLGTLNRAVKEISAIYSESQLSEPLQYVEFAEWQNDLLVDEEAQRGKDFWQQIARLGWPDLLLPFRLEAAEDVSIEVGAFEHRLMPELLKDVESAAVREDVAVPEFFLACWQTLLWRLTDQPEFIIGLGFDARDYYEDLQSSLGLFVKWLPLPCRLTPDARFSDLLRHVSQSVQDARDWQDFFLREEYDATANGNHQQNGFAVGYEFVERPAPFSSARVTYTIDRQYSWTEQFGLKLNLVKSGELFSIELQYSKDLYTIEDVRRLADQFETLIKSAARDCETPISRLNLLSENERRRLLFEFNATDAAYPADVCVHQLFEEQVDRTPDSPALVYEDETLTYAELDARANQLARHLRAEGIGPEHIVGLYLERCSEMVIAMLATLKAGAAYLPLDPQYPQQRLAYIVSDARVSVILTKGTLALPDSEIRYVDLSADSQTIEQQSRDRLGNATLPENPCYVLYTSGSTGRPKGVVIIHRALTNHMHWMQRDFPLHARDRVLQKTPFTFDASVWEFYAPLLAGAELVVAPPEVHQDPRALISIIREKRITILQLVPSLLRALLEEDLSTCRTLRRVFCGGEPLSFELKESFFAQLDAELGNLYGPTETTIQTSAWTCRPGNVERTVPIGKPIANTKFYIVDREMQPVPVWVRGRLFIAGPALARGYLHEPRLTAERFVPNCFGQEDGERLFDTRDVVRYRPDGVVEFFGRADHQVKLRGFRISLGEIESVLSAHPLVRESVVVVREDEPADQRLVAYVVPSQSKLLSQLKDDDLYRLPNDIEIAHLNRNETDLLYTEIFEQQCYLKHGVTLNDGDCVFDVGANIGLFTLFVSEQCADARIYAFEPLPPIFEKLQLNTELYALNAKVFPIGLSNEAASAEFTYYPQVTTMSGRYADVAADQKATSTFLSNYDPQSQQETDELLSGRFEAQTYECSLKTLSQVIAEQKIDRIDLLKIDVERSELDVLEGIDEADWPKIKQIVLEVEATEGRLERVVQLLKTHGYEFEIEQNELLKNTDFYDLFARRSEAAATAEKTVSHNQRLNSRRLSSAALRAFMQERLPEYMVPSIFVVLPELPLMQNGKVDRQALPAPEQSVARAEYVAPRTPEEETLAGIWCEVLHRDRISVHENFFELGGHSLLAMQIISRSRKAFQVDLPLRVIFESQTIAELAEQIVKTRLEQAAAAPPAIVPVSRDEELPLSFAQQRLWFLEELVPDSPFYNVPANLRLKGSLDIGALEQTLTEIVRRHEALRTVFPTRDGEPFQFINPPYRVTLDPLDLTQLPDQEREAEVQRLVYEEGRRVFNLATGPLIRASLLKAASDEHVLMLTVHHIVADGWSMGLIVRELSVLYGSYLRREPSPLPEPTIQYADFAKWQRQWLQGPVLEAQLDYWRQQLAGPPAALELPTDHLRPAIQSHRGAREFYLLPREFVDALHAFSRTEDTTLFMTLLAGFKALLHRYSGQQDISVGAPIANRTLSEMEEMVGFFANTLVFRSQVEGSMRFRDLLRQVRDVTLGAYSHQDLPFELIVERLQPVRDMSRGPLFQVMFSLQNAPLDFSLELEGLRLEGLNDDRVTAKFDITYNMVEVEQGVLIRVEYNSDLFEPETMRRMLKHYEVLLAAAIEKPQTQVAKLPLLTEPERRQLLSEFSAGKLRSVPARTISELFEQQVERTPNSPALEFYDERLSYEELNQRANKVAGFLRSRGVGPETRVGICMNRSVEMVVAVLGVLKAGGAYIPLDPGYPLERLKFMLADSDVKLLLTQEHLRSQFAEQPLEIVCLDTVGPLVEQESGENQLSSAAPDNLIYVIYTSGSTGEPKGIAMTHRPLVNLIAWQITQPELARGKRRVQLASLSFDASFREIFSILCSGGTILLISEELRRDTSRLVDFIEDKSIEKILLPFVALQRLLEEFETRERRLSLREVIAAGEQLRITPFVRDFFRKLPECFLHNQYGPSESHVVTAFELSGSPSDWPTLPPIGRPINNTRLYILDQQLQPAPLGVAGELFIGGPPLSRGYLNRPALTAEKFIPDPYSSEPGQRLYASGDLCRFLPGGDIEFIGRRDNQVKVRGYRIELGEVEEVLGRHPAVREAVVVARLDKRGENHLIAYYVTSDNVSAGELRKFLKSLVPDYMVPSFFVMLDALPLTPHRKLDRKALLAKELETFESEHPFVAPRTPEEEMLANIWGQVLGRDAIGVHDNFFELGGHSLLATQVISRARKAFNLDLPLRVIFERPTIAELAIAMAEARRDGYGLSSTPIVRTDRTGKLLLSFAQQRLWFLDQLGDVYALPAMIRLKGALNVEALESTITEIARRHEVLRTSFVSVDGSPVQVISTAGEVRLPRTDLTKYSESEREAEFRRLVELELKREFDLSDRVFHASLVQLDEHEHVFIFNIHHIAADGWSIGLLIGEFSLLYNAFSRGEASPLPELPVQYADFAQWQRAWLQGEVLARQVDYWKVQLLGAPAVLELPADRARPALQTRNGARERFVIPAEMQNRLQQLCRENGVTMFMTLLAAFQILLSRYSGQDDIVVGTPIANRNRTETESLIGFFVNTLVLRTKLDRDLTFRELLQRVREVCLGAYSHQDLPFEQLLEFLQPDRDLSNSPVFQVMFILQSGTNDVLELDGLTLHPIEMEGLASNAKFDLTLSIVDTAGGLFGNFEYNTDLFDAATVERMVGHFQTLLESAVETPDKSIALLPLLTREEESLLDSWNPARTDYDTAVCLHELFEAQVERSRDHVALVHGDERLTYAELDARANALAHKLKALGVGADVPVGVFLPRSTSMIVGLLAILKAGGAYVPLDPAYPQQRLAFMIEDTRMPVVLSHSSLAQGLPQGITTLLLDEENQLSDWRLATTTRAEHLAYLIYTSGSTGQPKGVGITHRNASSFLHWCRENFSAAELSGVLASTSLSFDLSVFEIFAPLTCGGTVILVENALSCADLAPTAEITLINTVPSAMKELVRLKAAPPSVQVVNLAGEALSRNLVNQIYSETPARRVLNLYGPTESTTYATYTVVENNSDEAVTIGRPVANTQVYLLDRELRRVPVGVPGELHIAGAGLAGGYVNRPDLTAERFIPNPFAEGERLYKTGDLARYRIDGQIEYLGRLDHQVKLHGYRIELGEIELALRQQPAIRDAVVVIREHANDKQLVAYLVVDETNAPGFAELQAELRQKLPSYMVPALFITLPALPLTPNGKIDRRALPEPQNLPQRVSEYVAPRTPEEEVVAGIWAGVLRVERVGVYDNFFVLGGHSLLATQVVSRLREAFHIPLPLRSIFEKPTVAGLAAEIANVRSGRDSTSPWQTIQPVSRDRNLPLSFAQERLWFLQHWLADQETQPSYNLSLAPRFLGPLDVNALERALSELVRRHEALRTIFPTVDGQAVQVILPPESISLSFVDLTQIRKDEREAELQSIVNHGSQQPFELDRGPMFRAELIELETEEHVLLLVMHHIVTDGWSMSVMLRELSVLYEAYSHGLPSPLPELPVQYADFAAWQREWLQGDVLDQQVSYWRKQLAGAPAVLELPTDKPRPAIQTYRGWRQSFVLPPELMTALKELGHGNGATLFMTLLSAVYVLLHRYSGQHDIVIGSPIANRNRAEIEGLIGFFINTLVLRTRVEGDESFRQVLDRVREVCLAAYAHQDVPFEKLVDELQPDRQLSHNPLFQVVFVFQSDIGGGGEVRFGDLGLSALRVENRTAKFDLTFNLTDSPHGLAGTIEYNTDLFNDSTITRLIGHFETLLRSIVAEPETKVRRLALMPAAEVTEQLTASAQVEEFEVGGSLASWFEAVAARRDEAVAVVCGDEQLSYRELNEQANRLAHYLRKRGVGPEQLVGVYLERSARMVVSLLGIVKAGGAYVPIDLEYPPERVNYMLADAGVKVVLSETAVAERLSGWSGEVVRIDADWARISEESGANPATANSSENVAYVIYTSGTTGKPKGTLVTHGNVQRLLQSTEGWYGFGEDDVWTLFHSYGFDFSVWEMWGALLYGGRLVVVPYLLSRTPEQFYELLQREGVTVLNQTPSAFWQLQAVALAGTERLKLRLVIFGGEALAVSRLREWYEFHEAGGPRLVNMYGITETTVHVSYRELSVADVTAGGSPIGCALPDLELYVLDEELQPAPLGVPGELYVGGDGVSRGYLNRPELTATRFVPHPYSGRAGARLYRSGDQARRLANGDIEYLGRLDQQVKIRGFRIELGEIETVLRQHPGIREAVVLARQDEGETEKRLVGYLVPNGAQNLTNEDLRQYLKGQLAEYMVPAAFVALEQLPLTAQGKIDRGALPAPEARRPRLAESYEAPRTWQEKELAEIWSQCLSVEPIGIHDNFFALGGDSIRSIRVLTRAKAQGIHFSLQSLFQYPTIYELTQHLETEEGLTLLQRPFSLVKPEDRLKLPPGIEDAYPVAKMQAGMIFHSEFSPETAVYHDIATYHLRAPLNLDALQATVEMLVQRHPVLRTSFDLVSYSEPLQLVHQRVPVVLGLEDFRDLADEAQTHAIAGLIETEKKGGIDLHTAPLLRVLVCRRSEESFQLTLSFHHAILDGWSVATLLTELLQHYWFAIGKHRQDIAPPPTSSFRDFVALERKTLDSETSRRYWLEKLAGSSITSLPRLPQAAQSRAAGDVELRTIAISGAQFTGLKELARLANAPLKSTLLAAHLRVLALLSGQADVMTGLVSNGRPEEDDGERVLGLFLNTLPFRQQLKGGTFIDLVRETFALEREMLEHRRYPLAELQQMAGGRPLFEVVFNFVHFHVFQSLGGLKEIGFLGGEFVEKTNFPLFVQFSLDIQASKVTISLKYDASQFSVEQIDAISGYYERTVATMAGDPASRYERAELLGEPERRQLLEQWNDTGAPYPGKNCFHELFQFRVPAIAEKVAVVHDEEQLTYGELNRRANQLARYLRHRGVKPGSPVAICIQPSIDMVVGLLAILKTGGSYIPLDPFYPRQRLSFILKDAEAPFLLTQPELLESLPESCAQVICLETVREAINAVSDEDLAIEVSPLSPAYVIYTSGSTGQPKGVQISHRALVNFLTSMSREPGLDHDDVLLAVTSLSFDIAGLEIYLPLLVGARLVLTNRETAMDGVLLLNELQKSGATVMQATPVTWRLLVTAGWQGSAPYKVLCGGEMLPVDLSQELTKRSAEVWNLYGPTETTIWSTLQRLDRNGDHVTIGRPIANTQIYLLDEHLQPVPLGVPGELYIGGDGLALAYHDRPALTAERFVPNPFATDPAGSRLYETGDLARYLPNGKIEYLGRLDQQIKLRGHRIELGDIEAVLSAHEALREAVVVARETDSGDRQLVAYVVRESDAIAAEDSIAAETRHDQVAQWTNVWDETYGQTPAQPDHTFNTIGWNSSYTGRPIPAEEMQSWVEDTVSRILALSPRRVLEIGCGTGLLLFRIAPQTEQYHATDVSPRALDHIAQHVVDRHHVTLAQRSAEDFEGLESGSFDTVILNSVVQYFPDVDYLASVLTAAVKTVKRGSVFLGDIRNLRLLEAFHTSVVLANSSETTTAATCRRLVQERMYGEEELFIDPDFFYALKQQLPEITRVEIQLKRGWYHNELTRFRYDVILHVGQESSNGFDRQQLDWQTDALSPASLRRLLKESAPAALQVTRVPNLRVVREIQAAKHLAENPNLTVGEIKAALNPEGAIDPENLWELAECGYHVAITWSETVGCFDVLFSKDETIRAFETPAAPSFKSLREFANDPLQGLFTRKIVPSLRAYLKDNLPDYMVPATFVLLDKLPLTPNGKIDRRALPEPVLSTIARAGTFIAPRTQTEEMVAGIWMRVLGVEQLGVEDNFFELGGHSLLATQIVTRVRASFKIDLPLRLLFEKPTVALLALEIERVIREGHGVLAPPIERVAATTNLPLSFAQQRLWFLDQLTPNNAFYNMQLGIRLNGDLSVEALTAALNEICRRHEVFRASFHNVAGDPVQTVSEPQPLTLEVFDLSASSEDPLEELTRIARAELQRPFDLSVAPLVRFSLFKTSEREHVLLKTMHHIISDGWSLSVFVGELAVLYRSYYEHKPSPLPELPIQYSDFARWQTEWLKGDVLDQHLDYWKKQLAGIPPTLELRTDRPRPALPTYRGARHTFTVKKEVLEALKSMSKAEGMTLFMTLLAAWLTLLSRYSGQEDICVGTPMANRNQPETEGLIGFFVDTLLLRGDVSGNPTFRTLMGRVRETALGAYAHQNIPFEKLVDELQPQRDTSRNPLFQVMFTVNKAGDAKLDTPGIAMGAVSFGADSTRFDLECQFTEITHELKGSITYSLDLFDATTIQSLVDHLQVLLAAIVENPDQQLSDLSLLTPAEERRLVSEWNQTAIAYQAEKCVHDLFAEQAAKTPENVAVEFADAKLSYRELNARANKLAHHLRALGVGPEVQVAICLERSLNELIAVLGVLKAGGVYVPLDPAYPSDRLAFMIEDSRSQVLLTEQKLARRLPAEATRFVCLDTDWDLIESQPDDNPNSVVSAENLAYLIYTSGSTGTPKGTMISHRGLANYLSWATQAYAVGEGNGAPLHSSLSFDLTVTSFFAPLLTGRSVILIDDGLDNLKSSLESGNAFSFVKLTPSHLDALIALLSDGDTSESTQTLIVGGEALAGQTVAAWLNLAPATRIVNEYGPTETVVGCCVYEVSAETDLEHSVPIGKPIANTQLYILDRVMQLTPTGVAGELYIAGDGVARGYINRPELTAASFVPNPFSSTPGARMYRTGDLVRYRSNGDIEYLGRIDRQIKLYGHRIELGEIESVLTREPEVHEAVVMARKDHAGEERLVAYVVANRANLEQKSWTTSLEHEQVENWQTLYDDLYKRSHPENGLNFAGWNSSYSGAPIPTAQMVEWRDATVDRIRELKPRRVLEIGCGAGLLLTQLAPECEAYWGTDFSEASLNYLRSQVTQLRGVNLLHRRADDFSDLPENYFDTIVLNSVVQYFPGVDYLMRILEGAIRLLAPGGAVFLGDVRNLQLLEAFHLSVQLSRAGAETDSEELRRRVRRAVRWDNELLVHPQLFMSLRDRSRVSEVDIHLKRGAVDSEMTRFRYDVVLRTGERRNGDVECPQIDWHAGVELNEIARKLKEERPESLRLNGVLNARVAGEVAAFDLLRDRQSRVKADELKQLIASRASEASRPEQWWQLGDDTGYSVEVCLSDRDSGSCYDVVYTREDGKTQGNGHAPATNDEFSAPDLAHLASNPLRPLLEQKLTRHLHEVLREKLAAYMVPAAVVVLDEMPLTQNGKIDWQALPSPEDGGGDRSTIAVAPRDAVELRLAKLWQEVLHLPSVSVTDNFFDLGGNSMAAVRLMAKVQKEFGKQLPLSVLFQRGTVEYFAGLLRQESDSVSSSTLVELQPEGTKPPVFFVHAAGGTVFSYLKLARRLGPDQPSYGIQSLGLINEHANELTIEEMAAAYVSAIVEKQPEGPYFVGGWSFGGVVAFEVARQLHEQGRRVARLALIDSRASAGVDDDTAHDGTLALAFARDIGVELDAESFAESLTPNEQLQRILMHAKRTNALPPDTDFEQILHFYSVYRANMIAWSGYRPQTYSGRVTLYRATDRPFEAYFDSKLGWSEYVTGEIEVQTIPGGHYTLLNEPGVELLASALKSSLE